MGAFDWDTFSKLAATAVAAVAAAVAYRQFKGVRRENSIRRFFELRSNFKANEHFNTILNELYSAAPAVDHIDLGRRIEFMGFFEDVAFLVKTGQMNKELAFYMFGGDAIAASRAPWLTEVTANAHWTLLHDFVNQMEDMQREHIKDGRLSETLLSSLSI